MNIRKNDQVVIRTGDDNTRGTTKVLRVLRVLPKTNKVVVEGANQAIKHVKPNRRNRQGGRLSKDMPISASNVMLYCADCKGGVRVGAKIKPDGTKVRVCKKCNGELGLIRKAKAATAKA
ncbi:MAG: 50S ribosomal protein L24 [Gemmatales bacterium]|jgi:large subunit ribosomal protein L24